MSDGLLPLRWKHFKPDAQSLSLSQSPAHALQGFLLEQPATPTLFISVGIPEGFGTLLLPLLAVIVISLGMAT
jgi:hypothetical protein